MEIIDKAEQTTMLVRTGDM